jgi:uncharacterized protein YecE (DUF72 family)
VAAFHNRSIGGISLLRIGTAGWALRKEHAARFRGGDSHLARYATRFNAVEINSSFYRPHQPKTYARWARETPDDFAFSVKMPKQITHELRLVKAQEALGRFMGECCALEEKLGCVLIQLPPSLGFAAGPAATFFSALRNEYAGAAALEPRNESWLSDGAEKLLIDFHIARVASDPVPASMRTGPASEPSGFTGLRYLRLHGSPKIYYANYEPDFLDALAGRIAKEKTGADVWCIFDNTALGHATENALGLRALLQKEHGD